MYDSGHSSREIADRFGVSRQTINEIVRGETWSHIGGPINTRDVIRDKVVEIRRRYANSSKAQTELAEEFGVSQAAISSVVIGKNYPDMPGPIKGEDY